jgi:hypothetical protein
MSALLIVAVLFLQLSVGWGRTYDCYMHCTAEANTTIYNTCTILTTYYGYNISECKAVFRQYSADTCNVHIYGFTVKLGNTADCEAEYPNGYPVQYYNGYAGPGSTCTPASTECDNFLSTYISTLWCNTTALLRATLQHEFLLLPRLFWGQLDLCIWQVVCFAIMLLRLVVLVLVTVGTSASEAAR